MRIDSGDLQEVAQILRAEDGVELNHRCELRTDDDAYGARHVQVLCKAAALLAA